MARSVGGSDVAKSKDIYLISTNNFHIFDARFSHKFLSDGALPLLASPHGGESPMAPFNRSSRRSGNPRRYTRGRLHTPSPASLLYLQSQLVLVFYIEVYCISNSIYLYIEPVANWPCHDSRFACDVQYSHRVELAAGKGKKRSVKKEGVQRERSSCGGEGRRGDAPSHTRFSYNET